MTEMTVCEALEAIKLKDISFEGNALRVADFARGLSVAEKALEKQIPTKPNLSGTRATVCPSCNRFIDRHEQKHGNIDILCCKWCGQALDWRDTE